MTDQQLADALEELARARAALATAAGIVGHTSNLRLALSATSAQLEDVLKQLQGGK